MQVGITGSWRERDLASWALREDHTLFHDACRQLGEAIGQTDAGITVGSDSVSAADRCFVEGYLAVPRGTARVRVIRPQDREVPFAGLHRANPGVFEYPPLGQPTWRHTRQQFIADVDAMITIGGGQGTYQTGLEMRLTRKRLIPIGAFGGASARLLTDLRAAGTLRHPDRFDRLNNPWTLDLASYIVELTGASEPSHVLLIHGHAPDRFALRDWLGAEALANPVVMAQEFTAGRTLPEKFELLADEADAAIALATPDDLASAVAQADLTRARARQNVWVEVGWFWGRLGRNRVLLLVRGDIEVPSDLDGIEYHTYERSALEREAEIRAFLSQLSRRNQ